MRIHHATAMLLVFAFASSQAFAQYQTPPPELARLVDAPLTPAVSISDDGSMMAVLQQQSLPSIEDLSQPELRLAGRRINPRVYAASRQRYATSVQIKHVGPGSARMVEGLPSEPRIDDYSWAPDRKHFAFTHTTASAVELWIVDVLEQRARRLTTRALNSSLGSSPYTWAVDGSGVYARLRPSDSGLPPEEPEVPTEPILQESDGKAAAARTYQDLLSSPFDEDTFEHFATSQLARIDLDGTVHEMGDAGVITRVTPSPSGEYVLTETVHRPFSYLVPFSRFPLTIDVIAADGSPVARVAELPVRENVPTGFGSTWEGPRSLQWRQDRPATLTWVEAVDGGDSRVEADVRDVMKELAAPFRGEPDQIVALPYRYAGATWTDRGYFLVQESWRATRERRMYRVGGGTRELVLEISSEDRYANPGSPMMIEGRFGRVASVASDGRVLFSGLGDSPDGQRPFIHLRDLATGAVEEVFRSTAPRYERPRQLLPGNRVLITTESADEPTNYAVVDLESGMTTRITEVPHPYPDLKGITRQMLSYERSDGVTLSAMLYLPPGYNQEEDGALPTLVWAYPREFKSASAASQVSGSPYRFKNVSYSGAIGYVTRGYAVLDNAAMPIVGEGEMQPNDAFVDQLVMNAEAVINEGARLGVVDPDRVAIGGHSYGAFMTANLLAHSDLFRAGIARSGAYNRSLTPFGFQAEPRTFWEAPEIYFTMSPFMNAEKINEPILLIHGMADNNSGTFPIQSERFYHALKGLGATARLVMLPHESHGYRARESLMHMMWETSNWLDEHVRDAGPRSVQVDGPIGE